jgi:hypothetical protein
VNSEVLSSQKVGKVTVTGRFQAKACSKPGDCHLCPQNIEKILFLKFMGRRCVMKHRWFGVFALLLAGCAAVVEGAPASRPPQRTVAVQLEDLGPAPELTNDIWLNTNQPLRLADLRGKVVLLDMWTFG